jgi:drug/metabolite transporter (DMT)-like permease
LKGRDLLLFLGLAALWGSSFLFIKVALEEVGPASIVLARLVFGTLTILAAIPLLRSRTPGLLPPEAGSVVKGVRSLLWPLIFLGAVNAVLPYLAIAWGEQFISSGLASIFNATVPLFSALLVIALPFLPNERPGAFGILGLLLGFAGVCVLVTGGGGGDAGGVSDRLIGGGAVLLGAASYAVGGVYARVNLKGVPALVSALGQNAAGVLVALPLTLAFGLPSQLPSLTTVFSLAALGVGGTGIAYILLFVLLERLGAVKMSTITYLLPATALLYGAVLLGEEVTVRALVGLALILAGVAGVTGAIRLGGQPRA